MGAEGFSDRLRRLRRDAGRAAEEPVEDIAEPRRDAGPPAWLRARLAARARRAPVDPHDAELPPARDVGPPRDLAATSGPAGEVTARLEELDGDHVHGAWRLAEARDVDPALYALLTRDAALGDVDLERAVFLDTETTGLSGGAGTYVYMVGLGRFVGGRFELWQGFLPDPASERALLAEVARRIEDADLVVSFFGKSFDRHRLEDKMRIQRVAPPFAARPHLDLYHPFQRLTKGRLPDGRLQTMERELCGLVRPDDLPGALAPAAWFDFVAGRAHRLEGVFRHNRDDVLSLVTLAAYLGRVGAEARADGQALAGCAAARAWGVARAYLDAGEREPALPWLERAVARARDAALPWRAAALTRAEALRRLRRDDDARAAFEEVLAEPEVDDVALEGCLGLAKLCEHALRDAEAALAAVARAERLVATGAVRAPADLERRRARLEGRCR